MGKEETIFASLKNDLDVHDRSLGSESGESTPPNEQRSHIQNGYASLRWLKRLVRPLSWF